MASSPQGKSRKRYVVTRCPHNKRHDRGTKEDPKYKTLLISKRALNENHAIRTLPIRRKRGEALKKKKKKTTNLQN